METDTESSSWWNCYTGNIEEWTQEGDQKPAMVVCESEAAPLSNRAYDCAHE